jgi:hypothetical protein
LAGLKVACILIECDDNTANLILVNSNLNQRHELLPSELAFAYKLQKESYEAKGQKKSTAAVAEQNAENVKKIQRYIKLTDLTPDLLNMVDEDRLPVTVGYELSYLSPFNMNLLSSYLSAHPDQKVSVDLAQTLHDKNSSFSFTDTWLNVFFQHPEFYKDKEKKPANTRLDDIPKHSAPALTPSISARPTEPTEEPMIPLSEGAELPEESEDEEPRSPVQIKEKADFKRTNPSSPVISQKKEDQKKQISKEKILSLTNTQKRDNFLEGWTDWPLLVEVPELKLTVREVVLPDKKRIVSMEYEKINTSYRHCYFQLLNSDEGISPFSDIGRSNIIEHLTGLRMKITGKDSSK